MEERNRKDDSKNKKIKVNFWGMVLIICFWIFWIFLKKKLSKYKIIFFRVYNIKKKK